MKIRVAESRDVDAIQALFWQLDGHHSDLLPEVFRSLTENARPDQLLIEWIEHPENDYLLAVDEGAVIGFVSVSFKHTPDFPIYQPRSYVYVDNAVVDTAQRGRGVGKRLFDAAIEWAEQRGVRYVRTSVWTKNGGAREFYVDQGFRPITERLELDLGSKD